MSLADFALDRLQGEERKLAAAWWYDQQGATVRGRDSKRSTAR